MTPSPNKPGAIILEGHVQGLSNTRSLGEAGIPVYVVDKTNCIARYSRYCKKFFLCPDFSSDEFAFFLENLALKENIRGWLLLPSNDHAVYSLSKHKILLEKYYKLITPGLEIIENIVDKIRLIQLATECGVPVPVTRTFSSPEEVSAAEKIFPVLTKGRYGLSFYKSFGTKAFLSHNAMELKNRLASIEQKYPLSECFTQELIPFDGSNKTISFTAFCVKGEIKTFWMGEKLREHPAQFGTATLAGSVYIRECFEQSVLLLKKLNYEGICEVEYLLDPRTGEYKLIEINARSWLWVGLAKACGVNFAIIAWEYVNGLQVEYPQTYTTGLKWRNSLTDGFIALQSFLKGHLSIKEYHKSTRGKIIPAVCSPRDLKPGFMLLVLSFYLARKRNILR